MGKRKAPAKDEDVEVMPVVATRSSRRASTRASSAVVSAAAQQPQQAKRRRVAVTAADEDEDSAGSPPATPITRQGSNRKAVSPPPESPAASEVEVEELPFKNLARSKLAEAQAAGRRPVFKNLKQILKAEEPLSRELPPSVPSYNSINAPPSLVPARKYCDITGLVAPYTDPRTGLRYASAEVFQYLQTLPHDYVQRFLQLRNAAIKLR